MARKLMNLQGSSIKWLHEKACNLDQWSKQLKNHLPPMLAQHCKVANYRRDCLVVAVSSPIWATRLRFEIPTLLTKLQQSSKCEGVVKIELITQPPDGIYRNARKNNKPFYLSKITVQQLINSAATVNHEQLRSSLKRLAKTLGRIDNSLV